MFYFIRHIDRNCASEFHVNIVNLISILNKHKDEYPKSTAIYDEYIKPFLRKLTVTGHTYGGKNYIRVSRIWCFSTPFFRGCDKPFDQ